MILAFVITFMRHLPDNHLKNLRYFVLLFVCHSSFSQDGVLPLDEHKQVYYSDVANPPKNKGEIYKSAQNWVIKTFGNYENAVTQQDPQSGKLAINTYVPVIHSLYDHIRFDLTLECKDNQYQARINNLDGISHIRTPARLGVKENDLVLSRSMVMKSETNRKKREEAERFLQQAKADNDEVNGAMYRVLAGLKEFVVADEEKR